MRIFQTFYHNLFDNPILTRELRRRMRGKALVYSIIGYIVLMSVTSILILLANVRLFDHDTQRMLESLTETGRSLFRWISVIQTLLVLIIAPTITAGMTTGEKERKTFDFLRVTTISPWMYIMGCFLSTVFYVMLALMCALPLISLAFLYGGVGRGDVLARTSVLLVCSMVLSSFGLLISSVRERTRTAQGIVVFLIFSALFGGTILMSQLSAWLGSGGGAAAAPVGAASGAAAGVSLMGIPLSSTVLGCMGLLALTTIFLLIATRKLFDPDETRALAHWQYGVIAGATIGALLLYLNGQMVNNYAALCFMTLGSLLLAVAALSFAVGRMEVGDEIWHMKRLLPFLRPFDQTVPFLVVVALGWFGAVVGLTKWAGSLAPLTPDLFLATAIVGIASYGFFCVFGRFATAVAIGRKGAGRLTLGVVALVWIVLPVLAAMVLSFIETGLMADLARMITRMSPIIMMVEGVNNPAAYTGLSLPFGMPGLGGVLIYAMLGVIFLALGEYKRFKRWRRFDYHYDMPAR